MNVKEKLQALLTASNNTTGETDTTLTDAVQRLVDGYGGGLPDWIGEMDVQTFSPIVDVSTEQTFSIALKNAPDLFIIRSNYTTAENWVFYGCICFITEIIGDSAADRWYGYNLYGSMGLKAGGIDPPASNPTGVMSATNSQVVFRPHYLAGRYCSFQAGLTYQIVAIKTKAVIA